MLASRESEVGKSGERGRQVGKVKSVTQGSEVGKSGLRSR